MDTDMSDKTERLINIVLSDEKIKNDGSLIYRDEPIITTGAELERRRREQLAKKRSDDELFSRFAQMKLAAQQSRLAGLSSTEIFVRQADIIKAAEVDDDGGDIPPVKLYYPTYEKLSPYQLKSYLAWRSSVRKGEDRPAPLTFFYLYVYELINLIGADSGQDAFDKLINLWQRQKSCCYGAQRNVRQWLNDMIVYYELDKENFVRISEEFDGFANADYDNALGILKTCAQADVEQLFDAIALLSAYDVRSSAVYKKYPRLYAAAACEYAVISDAKSRAESGRSFCEQLFGSFERMPYSMFDNAVFLFDKDRPDSRYEVSPVHIYEYSAGSWYCSYYFAMSGKSKKLGQCLKDVDLCLRKHLGAKAGYKNAQSAECSKTAEKAVTAAMDKLRELNAVKKRQAIAIDLSRLDDIRRSADITRDMLMTDEERDAAQDTLPLLDKAADKADDETAPDTEENTFEVSEELSALDDTELLLLRGLLFGADYSDELKKKCLPVSVAADSINEKLFDIFGDNVIEFDGDKPQITEDNIAELKGMIKQ